MKGTSLLSVSKPPNTCIAFWTKAPSSTLQASLLQHYLSSIPLLLPARLKCLNLDRWAFDGFTKLHETLDGSRRVSICIHNQTSYLQNAFILPLDGRRKFYPPPCHRLLPLSFSSTLMCLLPVPLFALFNVQHMQPYANVP